MIGFMIYIPFLVVDMVVSATMMSMGMFMLSPCRSPSRSSFSCFARSTVGTSTSWACSTASIDLPGIDEAPRSPPLLFHMRWRSSRDHCADHPSRLQL